MKVSAHVIDGCKIFGVISLAVLIVSVVLGAVFEVLLLIKTGVASTVGAAP